MNEQVFALKNSEANHLVEFLTNYMKDTGLTEAYLGNTGLTLDDFSQITSIPRFVLLQEIFQKKLPAYQIKGHDNVIWVNYLKGLEYYYNRFQQSKDST